MSAGTASGDGRNTDLRWLYERRDLRVYEAAPGTEYWYRPRQVLVAGEDMDDDLRAELRKWGGKPERGGVFGEVEVARWHLPDDVDIPSLVARLRVKPDGSLTRIAPRLRCGPRHCGQALEAI
jgi:hypothetical protein